MAEPRTSPLFLERLKEQGNATTTMIAIGVALVLLLYKEKAGNVHAIANQKEIVLKILCTAINIHSTFYFVTYVPFLFYKKVNVNRK